jgi:GR25 family glycosyltransferase involved in LPS biosynthesis
VVVHAFQVYGDELVALLQRSKIVINIHAMDGIDSLETVRISFALANRSFVISEASDHNPYGDGVIYAKYDALVETCLEYLGATPAQRASFAVKGYEEFRRFNFADDLRDAISKLSISEFVKRSTIANHGSSLNSIHEIHLINLDRSPGRFQKFMERNAHLANITRVSAVDGTSVSRVDLVNDGTIAEDLSYPPGSLGCALSHVSLWRKAIMENRVVTVMEDDVICSFNFQTQLERITATLPQNWDLIHWGYLYDPAYMWLDLGFSKAKLEFYGRRFSDNHQMFQLEDFQYSAVKVVHAFGTQAYSVSAKGAHALLECCLPLRSQFIPFPGTSVVISNNGVDCAMCAAYGSMQAFVCIPPLVIHDEVQGSDRIGLDRI